MSWLPSRHEDDGFEKGEVDGDQIRLTWDASTVEQPNNWVVAYRVYQGRKLLGTAYGTQFFVKLSDGSSTNSQAFRIHAVSANNQEGQGAEVSASTK